MRICRDGRFGAEMHKARKPKNPATAAGGAGHGPSRSNTAIFETATIARDHTKNIPATCGSSPDSHKRRDERPGKIAKTCIIERWHEDNAIQDHNGLLRDGGIADDVCDPSHSRCGKYGQWEKRRAQN